MCATIKDVAKLAGVSTATVSNVITRKKLVSDGLRNKVNEAIRELGYTPNPVARRLKTSKNYIIAVIVPDIANPFFADVYKNIEFAAWKGGYQLVLFNTAEDPERERKILSTLNSGSVDAIINLTSRLSEDALKYGFNIPVVSLDKEISDPPENVAFLRENDYKAGIIAADHLIERGYKKFICIAGPAENTKSASDRLKGFRDRLSERGYGLPEDDVYICKFTFTDGYEIMSKYLDSKYKGEKDLALFACNDMIAWGAIEACTGRGYSVPEDIAVIGNDNIWCSEYIANGMTTIENSASGLGQRAVSMIFEAFENDGKFREQEVVLDPKLYKRNTVR